MLGEVIDMDTERELVPKVSVIIPVYNTEKYLRECLDSVLNQTLKEIEVICIDDGSTDNSLEILNKYAQKDSRVIVLTQKNIGVGKTRNKGIQISKGEFVIFIDPDDFYPDMDIVETLYNKAVENNVNIAGGEFASFKDGVISQNYSGNLSKYIFDREGIIDYRDFQFDYGWIRFIYKADFLRKHNLYFPNYKRFQDPPWFCKTMHCAGKFYAIKKRCYAYRTSHKSINWDAARVSGVLSGLRDNLLLARKYGYKDLFKLTSHRLYFDYKSRIESALTFQNRILLLKDIFLADKQLFVDEILNKVLKQQLKKILQNIFSITNTTNKNGNKYKVITFFGIKLKIRRK